MMAENPLMASLHRMMRSKAQLGVWAAVAGRLGIKGVVLLSRGYLGPLADKAYRPDKPPGDNPIADGTPVPKARAFGGLEPADLAVLGLAATKLVFEVGEIALHNPKLDPQGKQPEFKLDENNKAPAMSIAHVAAAVRLWRSYSASKEEAKVLEQKQLEAKAEPEVVVYAAPPRARLYAARSAYYGTAPRYGYTTQPAMAAQPARIQSRSYRATATDAHVHSESISSSRGALMSTSSRCGTCGGSHAATPPPVPTYDPCAGGLRGAQPAPEKCTGCGGNCGCKSCRGTTSAPKPTKTYDSEKCPTFAISCETKEALRDCVKTAVCDFLQCVADTLCPDGRFDSDVFKNPETCKQLVDCVGQLACSFMHCVPDALCEPKCEALPAPIECVPCDYAVEVVR
jgi:hypothetical protein